MDAEINSSRWTDLKGKIKSKWSKFNDDDIESLRDNMDRLTVNRLQKVYGYEKDRAEREYQEFKRTLSPGGGVASNQTPPPH